MAKVQQAPPLIFLIGMMGSGKTTVGHALAEKLGRSFVDLDREIESRTRISVAEIFARHGEIDFRTCEAHMLRDLPRRFAEAVVATGGGAPFGYGNLAFMNEAGLTIWLDVSAETLMDRLLGDRQGRPLLERDDWQAHLKALNAERRSGYADAQVRVEVGDLGVREVVQQIHDALPEVVGH